MTVGASVTIAERRGARRQGYAAFQRDPGAARNQAQGEPGDDRHPQRDALFGLVFCGCGGQQAQEVAQTAAVAGIEESPGWSLLDPFQFVAVLGSGLWGGARRVGVLDGSWWDRYGLGQPPKQS